MWYCRKCNIMVDPQEVTHDELHEKCKRPVEEFWDSQTWIRESDSILIQQITLATWDGGAFAAYGMYDKFVTLFPEDLIEGFLWSKNMLNHFENFQKFSEEMFPELFLKQSNHKYWEDVPINMRGLKNRIYGYAGKSGL